MARIDFNVAPYVGTEMDYVREAAEVNRKICGDGPFSRKCHAWMEERFNAEKVLLTTSGTDALEMAAVLCDLKPGDEVILPSFTFSSTATAFQSVGATLVFIDIRPDTMNMDETKIEAAITTVRASSFPYTTPVWRVRWTRSSPLRASTTSSWWRMPRRPS